MANVVTADQVWNGWITCTNATTATTTPIFSATSTTIWASWNQVFTPGTIVAGNTSANYVLMPQWASWNTVYEETLEQKAAREAREAEAREAAARAREERDAAKRRSEELLEFVLTGEQMADYRERGYFEVISSKGRRWRIRARGQAGNVDLMPDEGGERDATYCIHPRHLHAVPDPDAHLAQALMLETDEDEFLKIANQQWTRQAA